MSTDRSANTISSPDDYVDTPTGLFTADGVWFHVREEALREYAGEVLEAVTLSDLLSMSATWLRSPKTFALWLLPALLWVLPWWGAAGAAVGVHAIWTLIGPSMVSVSVARALTYLESTLAQALYYVLVTSALGSAGLHAAAATSLVGFILFRWGAVDAAADRVIGPVYRANYELPPSDQVLRAFIIRIALNRRITLPQVDEMAADILENWGESPDR
jgi:hypothetical protein